MKNYDTTVARIAGNILSGRASHWSSPLLDGADTLAVQWAVQMAFAIVEEVRERGRVMDEADHAADLKTTRDYLANQVKAR